MASSPPWLVCVGLEQRGGTLLLLLGDTALIGFFQRLDTSISTNCVSRPEQRNRKCYCEILFDHAAGVVYVRFAVTATRES